MAVVISEAAFLAIASIISFFSSGVGLYILQFAVGIGVSLIARAIAGKQKTPGFSMQGKLQAGGDVPRSFLMGYSATAGSLVYANTWGHEGDTPNAYLSQVIAISDLPIRSLEEVWVNGELCTLDDTAHPDYGYPVNEYKKGGKTYLWIKFYDGTQVAADPFLVSKFFEDPNRPYTAARVGKGIAYVICTSLVNDKLFTGFPSFKFGCIGIPLYDPSKDSTNGGSGTQRWNNKATWGGDGDLLPAVQLYNVLRGITFNDQWLYGLQALAPARVPSSNWIAQIDKCRAEVDGPDGSEPIYRSGGQIDVSIPIADGVEDFLNACHGRLSEIGGVYKLHCGAPDSPDFTFTDDDILTSKGKSYSPFQTLADSINGIAAKYPSPADGWNVRPAPALKSSEFEAKDGNRRLMADIAFNLVPYPQQVQRLMSSALNEARRARRHTITLPPEFWIVEPGDIGAWYSDDNGYIGKKFRVEGVLDAANLDQTAELVEVDPSDYDWHIGTNYTPPVVTPLVPSRPVPQPMADWDVEPATIDDDHGVQRRPAIKLKWKGDVVDVSGVEYQVRLSSTGDIVSSGSTSRLEDGFTLIKSGLLPATAYEARGRYIPTWPRDMLWSDWLPVTTPDVRMSIEEFNAALAARVTDEFRQVHERLNQYQTLIDTVLSDIAANGVIGDTDLRGQAWAHRTDIINRIESATGQATASFQQVWTVATNTETALALFSTSVNATLGAHSATLTTYGTAIATLNGYAAAAWGVTLTVDGYVSGVQLINGGGTSAFIISADVFKVAWPGMAGGSPVDVFQISNVSGSAKLAFRGDMYADGIITGRAVAAATIEGTNIKADTIETNHLIVNSVTKQAYATHTGGTKYTRTAFVSATLTTKSDKISIIWTSALRALDVTTTDFTPRTVEFRVKVDGSLIKAYQFKLCPTIQKGSNYSSWWDGPFSLECTIENLTPGSHTFTIEPHTPSGIDFYEGPIDAGWMRIQDMYR